jgi:hypothetical protein
MQAFTLNETGMFYGIATSGEAIVLGKNKGTRKVKCPAATLNGRLFRGHLRGKEVLTQAFPERRGKEVALVRINGFDSFGFIEAVSKQARVVRVGYEGRDRPDALVTLRPGGAIRVRSGQWIDDDEDVADGDGFIFWDGDVLHRGPWALYAQGYFRGQKARK